MPLELSAGAVVFRREKGKILFLLLYRKEHEHYAEAWLLPRGIIEEGEELKDTVKREVEEETGIKDLEFVEGFKASNKWFYNKDGKTIFKVATYFLAETKTEDVKLSFEHDDYKWSSEAETLTYKGDRDIVKKAAAFLKPGCRRSLGSSSL
ncbi:MAG: NUDIX domain-containing protein [Candidatus Woesearchaeota archaeon]